MGEGTGTLLPLGVGMQENTPPRTPHRFVVLELALRAIEDLRPVVAKIRRFDRNLGEQLRTSLSAVPLHIAEGNGCSGGNRVLRFSTALGSDDEARATLRAAVAWGYVQPGEIDKGNRLLDSVAAMLYKLGARRQ
jgi:four helix bundle protein